MTLESAVQQYEQTNAKLVEEVVDLKSSYRASAAAANNLYDTVSAGLSATGTGEYFSVPGDGNYLTIYKNASGTAEAVATYPKADAVEQAGLDATSVAADRVAVEASATQVASDAADATVAKTAAEAARDDAVNIAGGDSQPIFDAWVVDVERRKIENATGGACTLERTAGGEPCYMFVIPKMKWEDLVPSGELGTGVHEAFLEGGVEKSELLVGMYLASTVGGELVSQAKKVPRRSINWDNSRTEAQAAGFDIMSTWEWSAIALWCLANGFQPRGNTNYGRHHDNRWETGTRRDNGVPGDSAGVGSTLTGSGPAQWRHDQTMAGIADMVGNVWEWLTGMKMVDARVFLSPDNAIPSESGYSDTLFDLPNSTIWSAVNNAGASDALKRALIVPKGVDDPLGTLYTNLTGERLPFRGGDRYDGGGAGLGALNLVNERTVASTGIGFRPRFRNP